MVSKGTSGGGMAGWFRGSSKRHASILSLARLGCTWSIIWTCPPRAARRAGLRGDVPPSARRDIWLWCSPLRVPAFPRSWYGSCIPMSAAADAPTGVLAKFGCSTSCGFGGRQISAETPHTPVRLLHHRAQWHALASHMPSPPPLARSPTWQRWDEHAASGSHTNRPRARPSNQMLKPQSDQKLKVPSCEKLSSTTTLSAQLQPLASAGNASSCTRLGLAHLEGSCMLLRSATEFETRFCAGVSRARGAPSSKQPGRINGFSWAGAAFGAIVPERHGGASIARHFGCVQALVEDIAVLPQNRQASYARVSSNEPLPCIALRCPSLRVLHFISATRTAASPKSHRIRRTDLSSSRKWGLGMHVVELKQPLSLRHP